MCTNTTHAYSTDEQSFTSHPCKVEVGRSRRMMGFPGCIWSPPLQWACSRGNRQTPVTHQGGRAFWTRPGNRFQEDQGFHRTPIPQLQKKKMKRRRKTNVWILTHRKRIRVNICRGQVQIWRECVVCDYTVRSIEQGLCRIRLQLLLLILTA